MEMMKDHAVGKHSWAWGIKSRPSLYKLIEWKQTLNLFHGYCAWLWITKQILLHSILQSVLDLQQTYSYQPICEDETGKTHKNIYYVHHNSFLNPQRIHIQSWSIVTTKQTNYHIYE